MIPHIDIFMDDGDTKEEWKMAAETRKILDPDIAVTATCVRVPGVHRPCRGGQCRVRARAQRRHGARRAAPAPGVSVVDHRADEGYVTPAEAAGEDLGLCQPHPPRPDRADGLNLWVVADNLRKGAALNAVQIAEMLVAEHLGGKRAPTRSNVEPLRRKAG